MDSSAQKVLFLLIKAPFEADFRVIRTGSKTNFYLFDQETGQVPLLDGTGRN